MPATSPVERYRKAATKKFASLTKDFSKFEFWRLGNSLDTIIDYLAHIDSSDAEDVGERVRSQCQVWLNGFGPDWPYTWFDDFGWWIISTGRASKQTFFSPELRNKFGALSDECWKRFDGNAPYVWDRRGDERFKQCEPAFAGGVWNVYWQGTPETYPGPKVGDPTIMKGPNTGQGIQNTVTNSVYLISAQRRGRTDKHAHEAGERGFKFMRDWLFFEKSGLYWQMAPDAGLVHEAVSHFKNGSEAPGYSDDWAWTGDLGLVLGIYVDRLFMGLEPPNGLQWAKAFLTGARLFAVGKGGVLLPWTGPDSKVPAGDESDFRTGTGVFWRYLLQAWEKNTELKAFIGTSEYEVFVEKNADAACADETDVDQLSNQVAALVAACKILA